MSTKHWLDLFTGQTWDEFLNSGATVSGFRESRKRMAAKIHPGDHLICYLTGISRFIGLLEVNSEWYHDTKPIWTNETFPVRFDVKLALRLAPNTAVPVLNLRDRLSIFSNIRPGQQWSGFFRGSPTEFKPGDAKVIVDAMEDALRKPVERDYDQRKYWRHAKVYESKKAGPVTVPDSDREDSVTAEPAIEKITHEEMQWLLLKLGSDLGLDVWVARNDRNREFNGLPFQSVPRLRRELPRQFDEATNKTVELIDVLWLDKGAIIAAFEVEHTSAIYSGLLRMSDLITMQPNIKINLYIVAPDERREKVMTEVNRPTFARLNPPLPTVCQFIPYSELKREIGQIGDRVKHLKHQFIEDIAEPCIT